MVRSIHKTKIAVFAFAVAGTLAITTNIKTQNIILKDIKLTLNNYKIFKKLINNLKNPYKKV